MKNKKSSMKRIFVMLKPHIKLVIILSILAIFVDAIEIGKPILVEKIIDNYLAVGIFQKDNINVTMIGIIYLAMVILGNITELTVRVFTNRMGETIVYNLRNKIYKYIEYSNISFHDRTPSGKLFTRLTSDVDDISALFKDVITTFIKDIVLIITLILIMIYISYKLSLISLIVIPIVFILSFVITKSLNKIYTNAKMVRTKLYTFFSESIYGLKLIKIFNRQYEKCEESKQINDEFMQAIMPARILESFLPAAMSFIENLGISIICYVCVNKIFDISVEPRNNLSLCNIFKTYF